MAQLSRVKPTGKNVTLAVGQWPKESAGQVCRLIEEDSPVPLLTNTLPTLSQHKRTRRGRGRWLYMECKSAIKKEN